MEVLLEPSQEYQISSRDGMASCTWDDGFRLLQAITLMLNFTLHREILIPFCKPASRNVEIFQHHPSCAPVFVQNRRKARRKSEVQLIL